MKIFLGSCVRLEVSFLLGVRKKLKGNFHKQAKNEYITTHYYADTAKQSINDKVREKTHRSPEMRNVEEAGIVFKSKRDVKCKGDSWADFSFFLLWKFVHTCLN